MKQLGRRFLEWINRFSTREACLDGIVHRRLSEGFLCPRCGNDRAYAHVLSDRASKPPCTRCRYQFPVSACVIVHCAHVRLPKWFAATALAYLAHHHTRHARVAPPAKTHDWPPIEHLVIAKPKRFLWAPSTASAPGSCNSTSVSWSAPPTATIGNLKRRNACGKRLWLIRPLQPGRRGLEGIAI